MAGWPPWHEVQRSAVLTETPDTKVLEDVDASSANTGLSKASTAATTTEDITAPGSSSYSSDGHAGHHATSHAQDLWSSWKTCQSVRQAPDWRRRNQPRMPSCPLSLDGCHVPPPSARPPAVPTASVKTSSLSRWQRPAAATAVQPGHLGMAGKFGGPVAVRGCQRQSAETAAEARNAEVAPRQVQTPQALASQRDPPQGLTQIDARAVQPQTELQRHSLATASTSADLGQVVQKLKCPAGHCLEQSAAWTPGSCDLCGKAVEQGEPLRVCQVCDPEYWRCGACSSHGSDSLPSAPVSALVPSLPAQASQLQIVPIGQAMYSCTGGCRRSWNTWEEVPYWSKNRPRKPWCDECGREVPGPWNEWMPPLC